MHGRVGAAAEEVGVAAVQPDARERTQLGVAIQEAGRARERAVWNTAESSETRRRWRQHHSRNPGHRLRVAGEVDLAGLEG